MASNVVVETESCGGSSAAPEPTPDPGVVDDGSGDSETWDEPDSGDDWSGDGDSGDDESFDEFE